MSTAAAAAAAAAPPPPAPPSQDGSRLLAQGLRQLRHSAAIPPDLRLHCRTGAAQSVHRLVLAAWCPAAAARAAGGELRLLCEAEALRLCVEALYGLRPLPQADAIIDAVELAADPQGLDSPPLVAYLQAVLTLSSTASAVRCWALGHRCGLPDLSALAARAARRMLAQPQANILPLDLLLAALNHADAGPLPLADEDAVAGLVLEALAVRKRLETVEREAAKQLLSSIRVAELTDVGRSYLQSSRQRLGLPPLSFAADGSSEDEQRSQAQQSHRHFALIPASAAAAASKRKLPPVPPQQAPSPTKAAAAAAPRALPSIPNSPKSAVANGSADAAATPAAPSAPLRAQPRALPQARGPSRRNVETQTDFPPPQRMLIYQPEYRRQSVDSGPSGNDSGLSTMSPHLGSTHSLSVDAELDDLLRSNRKLKKSSSATNLPRPTSPPYIDNSNHAADSHTTRPAVFRAGSQDSDDTKHPTTREQKSGRTTPGEQEEQDEDEDDEDEDGHQDRAPNAANPAFRSRQHNQQPRVMGTTHVLEWDDDDILQSGASSPAQFLRPSSANHSVTPTAMLENAHHKSGRLSAQADATESPTPVPSRPGSAPITVAANQLTTATTSAAAKATRSSSKASSSPLSGSGITSTTASGLETGGYGRRSFRRSSSRERVQKIVRRTLSVGSGDGRMGSTGSLDQDNNNNSNSGATTPTLATSANSKSLITLPPPALWTDDQLWEPTLFVMGGAGVEGISHAVQSYHRATETWVTMPDTILPRDRACCCGWRENIFVFGGDGVEGSAERYNISFGMWETIKPSYACLSGASAVTVNDAIYLCGGCNPDQQPLAQLQAYDPITNSWQELPPPPHAHALHASVAVLGRYMLVIGGVTSEGGQPVPDVEAYDTQDKRWFAVAPLNEARSRFAAVVINNTVMVFGGMAVDGSALASVEYLSQEALELHAALSLAQEASLPVDPEAKWKPSFDMPHARYDMAACTYFGRVAIMGGTSPTLDLHGSDAILFLDLKEQRWGYHSVLANRRRLWSSNSGSALTAASSAAGGATTESRRAPPKVSPGRAVLSTLGVRARLCAVVVYCPAQVPTAEILEAVAEFERDFGTLNFPSGAKTVYNVIRGTTALEGCSLDALVNHPGTPSKRRIQDLLRWLTEQGLIYSSVKDCYLPTLALD